jgi:hypothetical protein
MPLISGRNRGLEVLTAPRRRWVLPAFKPKRLTTAEAVYA